MGEEKNDCDEWKRLRMALPIVTFSIVELQLQSSIRAKPISNARSAVMWLQGAFSVPDWMIPRRASPLVTGDKRCKFTALPPADSPNRVIRSGSPPKAWAFSFSHLMARAWSHIPTLPVNENQDFFIRVVEDLYGWDISQAPPLITPLKNKTKKQVTHQEHLRLHLEVTVKDRENRMLQRDIALMRRWHCQERPVLLHCRCPM